MKCLSGAGAVIGLLSFATVCSAAELTVEVDGVESGEGNIFVAVCAKAEYPRNCALRQRIPAHEGTVSARFTDVAVGTYAALVFHDANGNSKLDFDPSGIPVEGTGVSNNVQGPAGLPSFQQASFKVEGGDKISVRLHY